jgi:hypothetical protein
VCVCSVYFEPVTWDEWTVGFDTVPGGTSNSHRSVLSYHYYVPPDVSVLVWLPIVHEMSNNIYCDIVRLNLSLLFTLLKKA